MSEDVPRLNVRLWFSELSQERRVSVIVLGCVSVGTLVLSILFFRAQIISPFLVSKSLLVQSQALTAADQPDSNEALKNKDTDRDGLSDYAETTIYGTSAYLTDSDSDGIPDSVEVAQGTNPKCAEGTNCAGVSDATAVFSNTTDTLSELKAVTKIPQGIADVAMGGNQPEVVGASQFLNNPPPPNSMTPVQIRDYLISNNLVQPSQLDGLPDATVQQVYQAAYEEALRVREAQRQTSPTTTQSSP